MSLERMNTKRRTKDSSLRVISPLHVRELLPLLTHLRGGRRLREESPSGGNEGRVGVVLRHLPDSTKVGCPKYKSELLFKW